MTGFDYFRYNNFQIFRKSVLPHFVSRQCDSIGLFLKSLGDKKISDVASIFGDVFGFLKNITI